ncbi:hypothetical protein [Natronorubrum tibetense]|uniref:Ig-like domain-containing protein n=1 Tax=Natronorubrum tibetense GA33 TaxID=1114856 RepID=L9VUQ1_9EURY|nr:hypothetical protein [Natronorubrum tibetense]ELY40756.1 hypothetical protein C496_11233 [Natronorubrum tibetense GA33]
MKRRALLSTTGVSLLCVSGCTSVDDDPALPLLDSVSVRNRYSEPRDVDVTVTEGEETRFSETYTIDPGSEPVEEAPVDGAGQYLIRAATNDSEQEVAAADNIDGEERCVSIRFEISSTGGFTPPSIISSRDC